MRLTIPIITGLLLLSCNNKLPSCSESFSLTGYTLTENSTNFSTDGCCIEFADEEHGYMADPYGSFYRTTDGAVSWATSIIDTNFIPRDIFYLKNGDVYIYGNSDHDAHSAMMYLSHDDGVTWSALYNVAEDSFQLSGMLFMDESNGFVVGNRATPDSSGNSGKLYVTTDGGDTWNTQEFPDYFSGITNYGTDLLIYAGNGKYFRSNDFGVTWTPYQTPAAGIIKSMDFYDTQIGYFSADEKLYKTSDGGNSWKEMTDVSGDILAVAALGADNVYAFGTNHYTSGGNTTDYGEICYSTDAGDTWTVNESLCATRRIWDVKFAAPGLFYLPSEDYSVLRFER